MGRARTRLGEWHYDDYGFPRHPGDPAIVLLHGLMLDRRMWTAQLGGLRALGRVVVFDGPGHGLSDVPPPFTLEEQAEAIADALGTLGIERALLVGHSWGGLAALRFALAHPERTAGLAIIAGSAEPEPALRRLEYHLYLAWVRRFGAPLWFVRARLGAIVYGARARRARPGLVADLHRTVNGHAREGLARAALAVIDRGGVTGRLYEVKAPTLVAAGRSDRTMEPARSEALARRVPGARLLWVSCGHTPPVERPDEINAALATFVRRVLSARASSQDSAACA
jgi:pimeloyl-ACP methyl ester carboxylesterase